MLGPLTQNLLAGVLDILIETLKQMCAYAGSKHQFKLGGWHAHNLGIERKHVYLLDWEHTEYRPEMDAYKRIKPAMKTFLEWIPQFKVIPSTIHSLTASRISWMRKLGQIQEYLANTWWPHFYGCTTLPTTKQLTALSVKLMANFASDVHTLCQPEPRASPDVRAKRARVKEVEKALKVEEKVEKGAGVKEPTAESTRERRQPVPMVSYEARANGASVEIAVNAEEDYVKRASVKEVVSHEACAKGARVGKAANDEEDYAKRARVKEVEKAVKVDEKVEKGARVKEPAAESTRERRQLPSMVSHEARANGAGVGNAVNAEEDYAKRASVKEVVSHESRAKGVCVENAANAEEDYAKRASVKDAEKAVIVSSSRRITKADFKHLLRADKTNVRFARGLVRQGTMTVKNIFEVLQHPFLNEMFVGTLSERTIEKMKSSAASEIIGVLEKVIRKRPAHQACHEQLLEMDPSIQVSWGKSRSIWQDLVAILPGPCFTYHPTTGSLIRRADGQLYLRCYHECGHR